MAGKSKGGDWGRRLKIGLQARLVERLRERILEQQHLAEAMTKAAKLYRWEADRAERELDLQERVLESIKKIT